MPKFLRAECDGGVIFGTIGIAVTVHGCEIWDIGSPDADRGFGLLGGRRVEHCGDWRAVVRHDLSACLPHGGFDFLCPRRGVAAPLLFGLGVQIDKGGTVRVIGADCRVGMLRVRAQRLFIDGKCARGDRLRFEGFFGK